MLYAWEKLSLLHLVMSHRNVMEEKATGQKTMQDCELFQKQATHVIILLNHRRVGASVDDH